MSAALVIWKWVRRVLLLLAAVGALVFSLMWLSRQSEAAAEVITGVVGLMVSFFTSPFLLESSLAFICLIVVMTYNQRKLDREGQDEWVLLPKEEPAPASEQSAPIIEK